MQNWVGEGGRQAKSIMVFSEVAYFRVHVCLLFKESVSAKFEMKISFHLYVK